MRLIFILAAMLPAFVFANAAGDLQERLSTWDAFSAEFQQKTLSFDGEVVQEGQGQILLGKPNLIKWHTRTPDEMLIQSDGRTIWIFNPLLEEVTLYNQAQFSDNTPLTLLASEEPDVWQQYDVSRDKDVYRVVPLHEQSGIDYFELRFSARGLSGFVILDKQGQRSEFSFSSFTTLEQVDPSRFIFQVPDGIDVDDQREL